MKRKRVSALGSAGLATAPIVFSKLKRKQRLTVNHEKQMMTLKIKKDDSEENIIDRLESK